MAIGTSAYLCEKSSYLTSLHVAPDSAALSAVRAVVGKKDVAVVSAAVIFQIRQQLCAKVLMLNH